LPGIGINVATAGGRVQDHGDRAATQPWRLFMIARILLSLFLLLSTVPACAKVDWTDLWWDPSESGWGVNLVQSDAFMFATFFVYGPSGQPTWYTAEMTWNQAQLAFAGPLYTFTGTGLTFPWVPGNRSVRNVGSATFRPTQGGISVSYRGTLTYTFADTGLTFTKSIERQTLTSIDLAGVFTGGQYGEYYDCAAAADNNTYTDAFDLDVTQTGRDLRIQFTYAGGLSCTLSGALEQYGSLHRINGAAYRCSDGLDTTATVYDLKSGSLGIEGRLYAPTVGAGCREAAKFSAVYATGQAAE
jgi:hypothetical protein